MLARSVFRSAAVLRSSTAASYALKISPSLQWSRGLAKDNQPRPGQGQNHRPSDFSRTSNAPGGFQQPEQPNVAQNPTTAKSSATAQPGDMPTTANDNSKQPDLSTTQDKLESPASAQSQPLPDLTKGIPSTLEFETAGATSPTKGQPATLDLTEESPSAGGDRGGELPKAAYISSSDRRRNRAYNFMYAGIFMTGAIGTIYLGRNWDTPEEELAHPNAPSGWGLGLFWTRARTRLADMLDYYNEPAFPKLLPDVDPAWERPYTLVLSLEDLLVHSEWTREHGWRMAKRPGMDYFIRYLSQYYEIVLFTTVPSMIADPVVRKLDPYRIIMWPLFREATRYKNGEYIKDLSYLNRDLSKVILIDTVASHARNQPENAIILPKWKGDLNDTKLVSLIPFLEYLPTMGYTDVREVLKTFKGHDIAEEFARREMLARKKFEEQLAEERAKRPKRSGLGIMGSLLGLKPHTGGDGMELSAAEAFEQGKMLQDQARERGQRQYELLEKEIRENGEQWLKTMAAEEEKAKEEQMKGMKSSLAGMFGNRAGDTRK